MGFKDDSINGKLLEISLEIKQKRDISQANSEEKKYYRTLSKGIDKIL